MSEVFTDPLRRPSPALQRDPGLLHFSSTHLLIALVLLLIAIPAAEHFQYGLLVEGVMLTVVLSAAVLVVGGRKRTLAIAVILVAPALIAKWLDLLRPGALSRVITLACGAAFVAFIVVQLLLFVLRARRVNSEVLNAGICAYLLLALFFAFAYALASLLIPGSFAFVPGNPPHPPLTGFQAIYFSFVTLSTVGYGDIVPVSNLARMLAMVEATSGMFYVTVLIARLVSLYASQAPSETR